jgi:small subunit ribosomal protein S13
MARIAGVDLPPQKRLWVGLTSIYGIGQERAKKLAAKAGVDHTKKIRD